MIKNWTVFSALIISCLTYGQNHDGFFFVETLTVKKDTTKLIKKHINPIDYKILNKENETVTDRFIWNFDDGLIVLKDQQIKGEYIQVYYNVLPDFLTKTFALYDSTRIVNANAFGDKVYLFDNKPPLPKKPFDGLQTSGSITRGVVIGNNQNAVVNSNLDLQISGQLSDKIGIRASIQDSNIPIQTGGYSQRLDEFDQVFMEVFSNKWKIRGGDLFLENRQLNYLSFNKKVQGIMPTIELGQAGNRTTVELAGAVVRGQYTRSEIIGKEGNQGPYKLIGQNGERFVLVISGSERVFVNGQLLQRGENNQYIIDYNAGEIIFTALFPITSEMRIVIEYQYSERNFNRFVAYGGVKHQRDKWHIGTYFFNESDNKNQPLQQTLSPEQVETLKEAGDNQAAYVAPSAVLDAWSENKILYKKTTVGGIEIFEYSNMPTDELYFVRFTSVGANQGNYRLVNNQTVGKIYEYIAPIANVKQGDYDPIVRLIAPSKIQMLSVVGGYQPSEKTAINFEWAMSDFDQNTFSKIDNDNNQGQAGTLNWKQNLLNKRSQLDAFVNYQFIQKDFRAIERIFNIEFNRDWQVFEPRGNQSFLQTNLSLIQKKDSIKKYDLQAFYGFDYLSFSENYTGQKHSLKATYQSNKIVVKQNGSLMMNESDRANTKFLRNQISGVYAHGRNWMGVNHETEDVQEKLKTSQQLSNLSQRFNEFGIFVGRGDSTKVFISTGYVKRFNDSIKNQKLQRVNQSNNYYIKSRLIQKTNSQLNAFIQYRELIFEDTNIAKQPSLNSRINYQDLYFKRLLQLNTTYENLSGTVAQQEFTYLEVEPTRGAYMWNDYNGNGVQELEEFEIAPFPDLAKFIRVFLPNQLFIATHQNKFGMAINIDFSRWNNKQGIKKFLAKFFIQSSYQLDQKTKRDGGNFQLNPFVDAGLNLLGLNKTFRYSLFFNRGKTKHATVYTYVQNSLQQVLVTGSQKSSNTSHQLQYNHLMKDQWRLSNLLKYTNSQLAAENFDFRNYTIKSWAFMPKLSYIFDETSNVEAFFECHNKYNPMITNEQLFQTKWGVSLALMSIKNLTLTSNFFLVNNNFSGNATSAVGFQMLEGLQPGKNLVWQVLLQRNITNFLDINLNYQGRKSEEVRAIHIGNIQVRAYF